MVSPEMCFVPFFLSRGQSHFRDCVEITIYTKNDNRCIIIIPIINSMLVTPTLPAVSTD